MNKCSSGKNSYESERAAQNAAELGMFLSKDRSLRLSIYRCTECHEYHLTSTVKNKKKK